MGDFGIKVTQTGKAVTTTDIRDILLSSQFSMLKFHSDTTSSMTFVPGDYTHYVDFTHSLGYVPAYLPYYQWGGKTYNMNAGAATGVGGSLYSYSWADTTKIRLGIVFVGSPFNGGVFNHSMTDCYDDNASTRIGYRVGKNGGTILKGAQRFTNVNVPRNATISSATLRMVVGSRTGSNTDIKYDVYGIDEDNTADFGVNNPFERASTSASRYVQGNINNTRFDVDVKTIVEEITQRSNWNSGNAMAFKAIPRSESPDSVNFEDDISSGTDTWLEINYIYGSNLTVALRCIIFKDKIA